MKGTDGSWESKRQLRTDTTRQEENVQLSYFKDKKFTFRFPKGIDDFVTTSSEFHLVVVLYL